MLYRDVFEHFFIQHLELREKLTCSDKLKEGDSGLSKQVKNWSKGDLVDDYNPDWLKEDDSKGKNLELQEAKGSSRSSKAEHLERYYRVVVRGIEVDGRFRIERTTHIGSARGADILQNFKSCVRRLENDSLENYDIKNDGDHGSYPIVISPVS